MEELALWIKILLVWNICGFTLLAILWAEWLCISDDKCLLHPVWLYRKFKVNYFGCGLLTLIFNLLCPVVSVVYWLWNFIYFICTVGRKQELEDD